MRLWTVMCENFTNWGTLTVLDWALLVGIAGGWVYWQYKRKW